MKFDVVVIGGGTAGTTAAVTASSMGRKVALVEKNTLGGT
jgi:dihydrolipoamide dehydrogenase